tara:strand:+ start:1634 stop:2290 length:657 start_codon:yes stop_codon:yes gene_type:complete
MSEIYVSIDSSVVTPNAYHQDPYTVAIHRSTDVYLLNLHYIVRFFKSGKSAMVAVVDAKGEELKTGLEAALECENKALLELAIKTYAGQLLVPIDDVITLCNIPISKPMTDVYVRKMVECYAHLYCARASDIANMGIESIGEIDVAHKAGVKPDYSREKLRPYIQIPDEYCIYSKVFVNQYGVVYVADHTKTSKMDRCSVLCPLTYVAGEKLKQTMSV